MKLFDIDSKPMRLFSMVADMIVLNLCWVICSLPIVTVGASTVAMYTVLNEADGRKEGVIRTFLSSWRSNFGVATAFWIIQLVGGALLLFNVFLFFTDPKSFVEIFLGGVSLFFLCVFLGAFQLVYPHISRCDNSFWEYVKNSVLLTLGNFGRTICATFVILLPIANAILFPRAFPKTCFFWLSIGLSLAFYIEKRILAKVFLPLDDLLKKQALESFE